ncbi:MAG TPA: methylated-DNA--[protein]-cysteine S-methyltransferase [Galbitalea sp.]|jgi:methylated-DNA-[protein]-cysteine S-methyltransferase|nr:methylated-DNA--[protein]-cysteine S-methyltransferase [Galbitalea sp.]
MFSPARNTTPPAFIKRVGSPIGRIEITADDSAITSLSIERAGHLPYEELPEKSSKLLDLAAKQLAEYFASKRRSFELPLHPSGTPFQESIWTQLNDIEWGDVRSYGELGIASGRASAGRAVGGAVGANPIPIIIPCHRVLAGDRRITGYSGGNGIPTKVWLLEHENIAFAGAYPAPELDLDLDLDLEPALARQSA